jgi:multidrug resistance protein, MATE family
MTRLAAPLALAELGWMAMGVVDTIMAGPLGPAVIGAGSLGNMLFYPIATCGIGMLLGLDTVVAQSFGANDPSDCRRSLVNGVWLSLLLSPPLILCIWALAPAMHAVGANPRVLAHFDGYLKALLWSVPPLLLYTAFRRYLQAVNIVRVVTFSLVSANAVNLVGNYALIYGHWGLPALGLTGSGISTAISRVYMALVLLAAIAWHERKQGNSVLRLPWRPDFERMRRLVQLGLPASVQIFVEGAVFAVVTAVAARLDEVSLAAHSIAINVISTTYMIPLGVSSAAAVRVGQAVGRSHARGAVASAWSALLAGSLFMGAAGVMLWVFPRWIIEVFTRDAAVVATGVVLLRIAAFLELFDGIQVVATGALRGLGDTRSPAIAHFCGYWAVGLPAAYLLCFQYGLGVRGLWAGLSSAVILIGAALLLVLKRALARTPALLAGRASARGGADAASAL